MNVDIEELEDKIGYSFKDKNLLLTAITHSSYAYEHQKEGASFYERIEFLGDAVLELVLNIQIFRRENLLDLERVLCVNQHLLYVLRISL